mmetsp:Transcript_27245/g.46262  ORF Transcript_27245/g.46262 Transcript_27245/m.46262 type:complete len:232 (-) Transcript_27245:2881-3576(-)
MPSLRPGTGLAGDRDRPKRDHPPAQVLQNELVVRRHPPLRLLQVAGVHPVPSGRHQRQLRGHLLHEVLDRRAAALGRLRLPRHRALHPRQVPRLHHRQHLHLPQPHWAPDRRGPGVQPALGVRPLVPGDEAAGRAGHGQDHEGQPGPLRAPGAHPQGPAAVLLRAHGALPVLAELRGALLQPDHLVRGRHQRVPCDHPQDVRGEPDHEAHQRSAVHLQPPDGAAVPEGDPH